MLFIPHTEENYETANSYLSVADADEIIAGQSSNSNWNGYSNDVKQVLLIQASLAVDGAIMYSGVKVSDIQVLKFPRMVVDSVSDEASKAIPINIKFATASLCLQYSNQKAFKNITSETISKLSRKFKEASDDIGAEILAFLKPLKATTVKIGGMYE